MNLLAATLLTATTLAGSSFGGNLPQANVTNNNAGQIQVKKIYTGQLNADSQKELEKLLKECGAIVHKIPGCNNNDQNNGTNRPGSGGINKPGNGNDQDNGINKPGNDNSGDTSVSAYAQKVVDLVNAERAKNGLSALTVDTSVTAAANVRAKEITQSFSHTRPNGSGFSTALTENGASYRGSGENIAWGQKSPEAVMNAWMNSDGHRANILNPKFTKIGVGHYVNNGTSYWTQLFTY